MNLFKKTNSSTVLRTCTPCCPFDAKNLLHPQYNYFPSDEIETNANRITSNSDACCLSKLQVDCRIQYHKRKKKNKKIKRYDSINSYQNIKRKISSSNRHRKQKKFRSSTNTNSHYDLNTQTSSSSLSTLSNTDESQLTQQSYSSNLSKKQYQYYNKSTNAQQYDKTNQSQQHILDLKTSIDNLTQLFIHQQKSNQSIFTSFIDKIRHFFTSFKSSSTSNEECYEILERNHLTKEKLVHIYHLFDKNETIFLNWLQTIMPNYFLPLLLNYVKHFDSISTDNI